MRSNLQNVFAAIFAVTFSWANASVVLPGDGPYYSLRKGDTLYLYDEADRPYIEQLTAYNQLIHKIYRPSFNWKLDEREDLILQSGNHQVSNAYATLIPNMKTVWSPAIVALNDNFASPWNLLLLATHETAHLYQLNAKGDVNAAVKKIVGNAFIFNPFLVPIFIHPNLLTPTFLIEGNAVLNESRFNIGGRLHSGELRALVYAQIAAGDIDPTRLINVEYRYPYGDVPYLQGAYFMTHLAAKHGLDKTNQFFLAQGNRFIWPWILNNTFRSHFGDSYPQEIREYVRSLEGPARKQNYTSGQPELKARVFSELNQDADHIWFLKVSGIENPVLYVLNKKTRVWQNRRVDLPAYPPFPGKVFWETGGPDQLQDAEPVIAATDAHDLHHIEFSLYGEGKRLLPQYLSRLVSDQRAGKTVSLDVRDSWLDSHILINNVPFDIGNSKPILDEQGNVYYFRQNGAERILYRNREPVFKYEGFYGKPMEVGNDGSFYFIGNSEFGSTLYRYKNREITRMVKSDRVTDARSLNDSDFLVAEVGARSREIHIVKAEPSVATPANYSYAFPIQNLIPEKTVNADEVQREERRYSSWREMRYSSLNWTLGYGSQEGFGTLMDLNFVDPMEYQSVTLNYLGTQFRDEAMGVEYRFTKYLPDFFVRYVYEEEWWRDKNGADEEAFNQEVTAGVLLPLWRWRRWSSSIMVAAGYEKDDLHNDPNTLTYLNPDSDETYGTYSIFGLTYSNYQPFGFHPWRLFDVTVKNRLESEVNKWRKRYNTSLANVQYVHGFPLEIYSTLSGTYAWAENHDILVEYSPYALTDDIRIPRLTTDEEYKVKTAGSARLELTKIFDTPYYSARIPLGLERVAPFVVGQGIFLDDDREDNYPGSTFEWGYGFDLQILLFHSVPSKLRLLNAVDTRDPDKQDKQIVYTLKQTF